MEIHTRQVFLQDTLIRYESSMKLGESTKYHVLATYLEKEPGIVRRHQAFEYSACGPRGTCATKRGGKRDGHVVFLLNHRLEKAHVYIGDCDCNGWQPITVE